jgi:hypothetical protein
VADLKPRPPYLQSSEIKSMLLARLALFSVSVHGFGPSLAVIGLKLDPSRVNNGRPIGQSLDLRDILAHCFPRTKIEPLDSAAEAEY